MDAVPNIFLERNVPTATWRRKSSGTKYEVRSSVSIKAADYNVEVAVKRREGRGGEGREGFLNDTGEGGNFCGAQRSRPAISARCEMHCILNDFLLRYYRNAARWEGVNKIVRIDTVR